MARLPVPGGDDGTWGDVLNQFLLTSHNADGTFSSSALPDNSVTNSKIADGTISEAKLDGAVQTKLNAVGGDPAVGGDLSGTASNAQLVAGAVGVTELGASAVTDAKVATGANIAQSKIANLQSSLDAKVDDTDPRLSDERAPTNGSVTEPKLDTANSPGNGQVLSWNGTNFSWVDQTVVTGYVEGDGIAKITVGTLAPSGPAVGDVWINT